MINFPIIKTRLHKYSDTYNPAGEFGENFHFSQLGDFSSCPIVVFISFISLLGDRAYSLPEGGKGGHCPQVLQCNLIEAGERVGKGPAYFICGRWRDTFFPKWSQNFLIESIFFSLELI